MPKLELKNLDITFSDYLTKEQVIEAIERGFAGVDLADGEPIYLIKVYVGDLSIEQTHKVVKYIKRDFQEYGLENCIFVPLLKNGIQDIEVIEVPNERT